MVVAELLWFIVDIVQNSKTIDCCCIFWFAKLGSVGLADAGESIFYNQFIHRIMSWPQTLFSQFEFALPSSSEQMLAIKTAGETGGKRAGSHILVKEQYFVQSDLWSGRNQRVANHQCKWLLQQSQGWSLAYIRFFYCPNWRRCEPWPLLAFSKALLLSSMMMKK